MPVVATFDGATRRVTLDLSVAGGSWTPIDVYREYREWRAIDTNQKWDPLLDMIGGQGKGGGASFPRALRLLTDRNSTLTKLLLPDTGPYRTKVLGEISTIDPLTDPEPFDITTMTTSVIIDYQPPTSEIISVAENVDLATVLANQTAIIDRLNADEELMPDGRWMVRRAGTMQLIAPMKTLTDDGQGHRQLTEGGP